MMEIILGSLFVLVLGFFLWVEFLYFAGDKENDCNNRKRNTDNIDSE